MARKLHALAIAGLSACALATLLSPAVNAQTPASAVVDRGVLTVSVNDPRPLARALDKVEELCRCPITYEHVRFSPEDLMEVHVARNSARSTLIPRGGPFEFSHSVDTVAEPAMAGIIHAIVERYHTTGLAGRFRVARTAAALHVVPVMSTPDRPQARGGVSILDARIMIPQRERHVGEAVKVVASAVTEATGYEVQIGMVPMNVFADRRVVIGANLEPARDVLVRVLAAAGRRLSWRLFFDGQDRVYALNIHSPDFAIGR